MDKRIVILGGGPAGIEAAKTVARTGNKATIVTDGPIGGRATWQTLVPSRAWIEAINRFRLDIPLILLF